MSDNSAVILLRKLQAEKKLLLKNGLLKKHRSSIPIPNNDTSPFDIPLNWCWVRLGDISLIQEGPGIRKHQYCDDGIQFLTVTNILEGSVDLKKSIKHISLREFNTKYRHFKIDKHDIVVACSGGSWGKSAVFEEDKTVILNTSTLRLRFFGDFGDYRYLYYLTKTFFFKRQIASHSTGQQPNFGYSHYSIVQVPLPPLSEQRRIVSILDGAFAAIGQAKTNAERNLANLDNLKQSLLQKAFTGQLTGTSSKNNPGAGMSDNSAAILLQKLQEEKQNLLKNGLLKKHRSSIPIPNNSTSPFEIPSNWCWVRLGEISLIQEGPGIRKHQYCDDGIQFLTVTNILEGSVDLKKSIKHISRHEFDTKYRHFKINKHDIVIACSGGSWGKSAVFKEDKTVILNTSTLRLRFFSDFGDYRYLYYLTKTGFFKRQIASHSTGQQPNFGYSHYSIAQVPLPPLSEQLRIVSILDGAFAAIGQAKTNYQQKITALDELKQSLLQKAFTGQLTGSSVDFGGVR